MNKRQRAIPFRLIDLNSEGYHLLVEAEVNTEKIHLLADTGASKTAFDINYFSKRIANDAIQNAEQVSTGLGTNTMESYETNFEHFQIGELILTDYRAALLDLSHVNFVYEKLNLSNIQGVLGNDILVKYNALIDYKHKQIWLDY